MRGWLRVEALDAELAKRQAKKDDVEDQRWVEECQGDEIILMARRLSRALDRPRPQVQVPTSPDEIEVLLEQVEDYAKTLLTLANAVEREKAFKELEAAGALNQRQAVVIGPRRSQKAAPTKKRPDVVDVLQQGGGGGSAGKQKKLSRTEVFRRQQEATLAAKQAAARAQADGPPIPQYETVVKIGRVEKYDPRTMSGIVSILGPSGRIELPFPMSRIMHAGVTSLHPGQELECTIKKRADGAMLAEEIKISVGERAAALAELERLAEAAEENYRVELMRRRLD